MAWMDTQQAVEYAGRDSKDRPIISARTLNKLCRKDLIGHGRNGRKWLFKPEYIDRYLSGQGSARD